MPEITILPYNIRVKAQNGENLLEIQRKAGLHPDAPCGGQGTCGKCLVDIIFDDGRTRTVRGCTYKILDENLTIKVKEDTGFKILESGVNRKYTLNPLIKEGYGAAFDIGTTSVVCYLLDLETGKEIAHSSMLNPQSQYGADVISRCEYSIANGVDKLSSVIRQAMNELISESCEKAGINKKQINLITVVGNTCMHHLFLGIDPKPLTVVPYEASVKDEILMDAKDADLEASENARLQILPNIAGFVGADTIGCLLATSFDELEDLSLMIDIGTNGEMVMGNKNRMIACSTAAGPAFEGAKIECGMRGMKGAIDHVKVRDGKLVCSIIDDDHAVGICGSGLMDAVASGLDIGFIDEMGKISGESEIIYKLENSGVKAIKLCDDVYLSQKDIREVQLAKGAIAAGIELMAKELGIKINDIKKVLIAGAFGNYMDPHSACRIGMIPAILEDRIEMIGNAAGEGSRIATLNHDEFLHCQDFRMKVEFLELASSPDFQDTFVDNLLFE